MAEIATCAGIQLSHQESQKRLQRYASNSRWLSRFSMKRVMVHTLIKNPSSTVQATKYPRWLRRRRQTRPQNPQTRALKNYNRNKPTCTLHGPGYDLNLCKAMWVKAKSMKANWSSARGGGGHGKFTSDKQHLGGGKEPNTLATSDMDKTNLNSKISLRLCRREIPT